MNKGRVFYCYVCRYQGYCDRDIIQLKRDKILDEWRKTNLLSFVKLYTMEQEITRLFKNEQDLLDRCVYEQNAKERLLNKH